jgi:hypothetical protein
MSPTHKKSFILVFIFLCVFTISSLFLIDYNGSSSKSENEVVASNGNPQITHPLLPSIDYESLNETWYNPKIEMIIVVPDGNEAFANACKPLADWKNQKGVKTLILSNYSKYPGEDNQSKIRNMIKSYYESDGIRWVLLSGDAQDDLIPIRKIYNPDTIVIGDTELHGFSQSYKPTDYYYADLTGSWDTDGDGIYGEKALFSDEINWIPEVYVGRLPASNVNELSEMINKTLKYEKNPEIGDWMNRMLLAGGVSDPIDPIYDPDGEDEARLTSYILQYYVQDQMNFTHLCRTTSAYTPPAPYEALNHSSFNNSFNDGYSTILFAGHGDYDIFSDDYSGPYKTLYTNEDAQDCSNTYNPSLVYADACTTSCYDNNFFDDNIGEILIKDKNGGAIGYIGGLRLTWYYTNDYLLEALNRGNAKHFWKLFFEDKTFQQGKALYDSKVSYMNSFYYKFKRNPYHVEAERKQLSTYCLLGDPEVDIYTGIPGKIENISLPITIYEGQLVEIERITDNYSRIVPYPRLYIRTEDGIERTVYGDKNGNVKFRLPLGVYKTYNISISGHNLDKFSYFNFTTQPDEKSPKINNILYSPNQPTVSTNINCYIKTSDNESGIESLFLIYSTDNFKTYQFLRFKNDFTENQEEFLFRSLKLEPADYQYILYARDYASHGTYLWLPSFQISIKTPVSYYFIEILAISFAIIAAGFCIYCVIIIKKYPKNLKNFREFNK